MIPKIIHYVWVGSNEMGGLERRCLESWKKFFPDFKIKCWNESNIPTGVPYLENAFAQKKWANISNYMRLHALKEEGGIYFDTDFEVIQKFDFLEDIACFIGFESRINLFVNNAIMGSEKNHSYIVDCFNKLISTFPGDEAANLSSPVLATEVLQSYGELTFSTRKLNNVTIFSPEYFSPYEYGDVLMFTDIKQNTYGIHHWQASWVQDDLQSKLSIMIAFKQNIESGNISGVNLLKLLTKFIQNKIRNRFKFV